MKGVAVLKANLGYAIIALSIWLAWEVVKAPLASRAPVALALRIAPQSPEVLERAAEAELAAERFENAAELADASLGAAPFNARALRTRGIAEGHIGEPRVANDMVTLAGNWSLRDNAAHSWLVEQRLRSGDYSSAFAHADTLARRRPELRARVFNLYIAAALQDARGGSAVVALLATNPPWRHEFLDYLQIQREGDALLATLALALQSSATPLSDGELYGLYQGWLSEGRGSAVKWVRDRIQRPSSSLIVDGGFADGAPETTNPFAWQARSAVGLAVEVVPVDDARLGNAAHVTYSGYLAEKAIGQTLMLPAGTYSLSYKIKTDAGDPDQMEVAVSCIRGAAILQSRPETSAVEAASNAWKTVVSTFTVPATGCDLQDLAIYTRFADSRRYLDAWFDNFEIAPSSRRP